MSDENVDNIHSTRSAKDEAFVITEDRSSEVAGEGRRGGRVLRGRRIASSLTTSLPRSPTYDFFAKFHLGYHPTNPAEQYTRIAPEQIGYPEVSEKLGLQPRHLVNLFYPKQRLPA